LSAKPPLRAVLFVRTDSRHPQLHLLDGKTAGTVTVVN
jgi:hypothetical protein